MLEWLRKLCSPRRRQREKEVVARLEKLAKDRPQIKENVDALIALAKNAPDSALEMIEQMLDSLDNLRITESFEVRLVAGDVNFSVTFSEDGKLSVKKIFPKTTEDKLSPEEKALGKNLWLAKERGASYAGHISRLTEKIIRGQFLVQADEAFFLELIREKTGIELKGEAVICHDENGFYLTQNNGDQVAIEKGDGDAILKRQGSLQKRREQLESLHAERGRFITLKMGNDLKLTTAHEELIEALRVATDEGRIGNLFRVDGKEGIIAIQMVTEELDCLPKEAALSIQKMLDAGVPLPGCLAEKLGLRTGLEPKSDLAKNFDEGMLPPEMVDTPTPAPPAESDSPPSQGELRDEIDRSMGA